MVNSSPDYVQPCQLRCPVPPHCGQLVSLINLGTHPATTQRNNHPCRFPAQSTLLEGKAKGTFCGWIQRWHWEEQRNQAVNDTIGLGLGDGGVVLVGWPMMGTATVPRHTSPQRYL